MVYMYYYFSQIWQGCKWISTVQTVSIHIYLKLSKFVKLQNVHSFDIEVFAITLDSYFVSFKLCYYGYQHCITMTQVLLCTYIDRFYVIMDIFNDVNEYTTRSYSWHSVTQIFKVGHLSIDKVVHQVESLWLLADNLHKIKPTVDKSG